MTAQDKKEMFEFNLARGIENAKRHGLAWQTLEHILEKTLEKVRAKRIAAFNRDQLIKKGGTQ